MWSRPGGGKSAAWDPKSIRLRACVWPAPEDCVAPTIILSVSERDGPIRGLPVRGPNTGCAQFHCGYRTRRTDVIGVEAGIGEELVLRAQALSSRMLSRHGALHWALRLFFCGAIGLNWLPLYFAGKFVAGPAMCRSACPRWNC